MHRKTYQVQGKAYKSFHDDLYGLLGKWEHRAEILAAIAHEQRASGRHEAADAYNKQAIESKKHAESVRKKICKKFFAKCVFKPKGALLQVATGKKFQILFWPALIV